MAGNGERSESTKISPIFERYQTEGNDDEQNCLFVNVPTEQERRIAAQSYGSHKYIPGWVDEKLDKSRLGYVSLLSFFLQRISTYYLRR